MHNIRTITHIHTLLTGPTITERWDTVAPGASPKYNTLEPDLMKILSTPKMSVAIKLAMVS